MKSNTPSWIKIAVLSAISASAGGHWIHIAPEGGALGSFALAEAQVQVDRAPGIPLPELGLPISPDGGESDIRERRERQDTIAIALGDSFVSGEGAEAFTATSDGAANYRGQKPADIFEQPVRTVLPSGEVKIVTDPYFCHVSRNSSIFSATLPGIDVRKNLACSGANPGDLIRPNPDRNDLQSQNEQLLSAIDGKNLKIVKVSMGSNNRFSTFANIVGYCHAIFMGDAAGGVPGDVAMQTISDAFSNEQVPDVALSMGRNGCLADEFLTQANLDFIRTKYVEGLTDLIDSLTDEFYRPGEWTLVIQGYASPFAPVPHANFQTQNLMRDSAGKFVELAKERYAAGCSVHELTMRESGNMANILSQIGEEVALELKAAYPDHKIIYMDVQRAFDGGRLCETALSPAGALFNPIWFRSVPMNRVEQAIPAVPSNPDLTAAGLPTQEALARGTFAGKWSALAGACVDKNSGIMARCQESAHPNAEGHAVLGSCLSKSIDLSSRTADLRAVNCTRDARSGAISVRSR